MVTLYTKPGCPPCVGTKRALDKAGIAYQQFDVTENPDAADAVRALGYLSAPVVVVNDDWHWTGLKYTEIETLAKLSA